jgi:hypothetical protein
MKSKGISVLILSIALILSVTLILVSSGLAKPKPKSELITFLGDLEGSQEVVGCFPNAGPFPEYTMTLSEETFETAIPKEMTEKPLDGIIFMNFFGAGKNKFYLVQFEWTELDKYFIEILGGVIERDRKAKIVTVTFVDVPCDIWIINVLTTTVPVTFTLTRKLKLM